MKILYLILAFTIGLFIGYLLFNDSVPINISPPSKPVAEIKAKIIDGNKVHADSILQKRNELLSGQLKIATSQLKANKSSLLLERQKINGFKQTVEHDSLPCKNKEMVDSLTNRIDKLNAVTDTMFSIYDTKVLVNEKLIAVRDSELIVCNRAYQQTQSLVQEQVARERQLTDDLNKVLKQQKRKRVQSRLLSIGALFVAGFTTSLIIKTKQ